MSVLAPRLVTSIGLVCDIIGAALVAWEVVRQFKGKRIVDNILKMGDLTQEYEAYETSKFRMMGVGLAFLTVGFVLQIVAVWIPVWIQ